MKLVLFLMIHFLQDLFLGMLFLGLLWCAPERLRSEPQSIQGNHKCDVYSFAIILQECHSREGAWSGTFLEPQGNFTIYFLLYAGLFKRECSQKCNYNILTQQQALRGKKVIAIAAFFFM